MKRKTFIKYLMAEGVSRNEAVVYANGCHGEFSHLQMIVCVLCIDIFREAVRAKMPELLKGGKLKVRLDEEGLLVSFL